MFSQNLVHPIHDDVRLLLPMCGALLKINKAMMTHEYQIEGMTCGSCVNTVQDLLSKVPGITKANVSLGTKTVKLDMNSHVGIHTLQYALKDHPRFTIKEKHASKQAPFSLEEEETKSFFITYKPILLVFAYIFGTTVIAEAYDGTFSWMSWMRYFMAGFFLVFSFFKFLDLPSFAASYSSYDIIAKKWTGWGYVYPFVELMLGLLFLLNFDTVITNSATFILMSASSIGVIQSLMARRKIKCACLGAVFNLPMSTITLIEDFLMVGMSAYMIIYHI